MPPPTRTAGERKTGTHQMRREEGLPVASPTGAGPAAQGPVTYTGSA